MCPVVANTDHGVRIEKVGPVAVCREGDIHILRGVEKIEDDHEERRGKR